MRIISEYRVVMITCADCAALLNKVCGSIPLRDIRYVDPFTIQVRCSDEQLHLLASAAEKVGAEVTLLKGNSLTNAARQLLRRPVLLLMTAVMLFFSIFLPTRILFVRVEGNSRIPAKKILESAENCGIVFGAKRSLVRSEQVKNRLLEQIPQLQWVGINTAGCTAGIYVREKTDPEEQPDQQQSVSSIVAAKDGIVLRFSVTSGTALCRVGQAVRAGQILISGYTDNGLTVSASRANGEVQAMTSRSLQVVTPSPTNIRGDECEKRHYYSIRLGKNLIKLQKDSGISDDSCAKIYEEEYACLPGGFQLPVSLVRTTVISYETQKSTQLCASDTVWLTSYAEKYLRSQMIGGEILSSENSVEHMTDSICLQSEYICKEIIGRTRYEESMYQHGEND